MVENTNSGEDGYRMLQSLQTEIDHASKQLNDLRKDIESNSGSMPTTQPQKLAYQARVLQEETKLMKASQPEGYDEDVRYFVAVGQLEQSLTELKEINNIAERSVEGNEAIISDLQERINLQQGLVQKMKELVDRRRSEAQSDQGKAKARLEMENKLRATRQITQEFKAFLVEFVNKMGSKDNLNEGSVPMGFLLQSLWAEFQQNGIQGWVNIEELDYEVRDEDVDTLYKSGIILRKDKNPNVIQLEDFTE